MFIKKLIVIVGIVMVLTSISTLSFSCCEEGYEYLYDNQVGTQLYKPKFNFDAHNAMVGKLNKPITFRTPEPPSTIYVEKGEHVVQTIDGETFIGMESVIENNGGVTIIKVRYPEEMNMVWLPLSRVKKMYKKGFSRY